MADAPHGTAPKGTVNLPMIGRVKKGYAIAGFGVTVGIVFYAYYRHKNSAASTAASTTAADPNANIDPSTGFPYGSPQDVAALAAQNNTGATQSIDPATGFLYGSAADQAALAAQSGAGGTTGSGITDGGGGGGTTTTTPVPTPVPVPVPTPTPTPTPKPAGPATNSAWAALVEKGGLPGYSTSTVTAALNAFIAGRDLSGTQATIVQMAEAEYGRWPGKPNALTIKKTPVSAPPHVAQHTVTAEGNKDLQATAVANGVTEAELAKANPALAKKYEGTGHVIPKGTHVVIPAH